MRDEEIALELLKLVSATDPEVQLNHEKMLGLYRKCLEAVQGKPE